MNSGDIEKARALAEQRTAAALKETRLTGEPLRLVLGKGSGELEIVLSKDALHSIQAAAIETIRAEIAALDEKLRALGVDI